MSSDFSFTHQAHVHRPQSSSFMEQQMSPLSNGPEHEFGDRARTPRPADFAQGMNKQDVLDDNVQWAFTAPELPSPAAHDGQGFSGPESAASYMPENPLAAPFDHSPLSGPFQEPFDQGLSPPFSFPANVPSHLMRPMTAPSYLLSSSAPLASSSSLSPYNGFGHSSNAFSNVPSGSNPQQSFHHRFAGYQQALDQSMAMNMPNNHMSRGRVFSLPENALIGEIEGSSRPANSAGPAQAYFPFNQPQAYPHPHQQSNPSFSPYPAFPRPGSSHSTSSTMPIGMNPAAVERNSSYYPFSHDPFPVASASRPNTANRPSTAQRPNTGHRPQTGNSIRPDTGCSEVSTAYGEEGSNESDDPVYVTDLPPDEVGGKGRNGQAKKKRARRRFDEIERMYNCNYGDCTKSYGCLNHLNAHVAAQKHGNKRLPSEFTDMRKAWRARKKAAEGPKKRPNTAQHPSAATTKAQDRQQEGPQRPMTGPTHLTPNGLAYPNATLPSRNMGQNMRPQTAPQGFSNHMAIPPSVMHMGHPHANQDAGNDNPFQFAAPPMMMPTMQNPYQTDHPPHRKNSLPTNGLQLIPEHSDYFQPAPIHPSADSPSHQMSNMQPHQSMLQASNFTAHHLQHARPPPLY